MTNNIKTILITGASSGIGSELARQYASPNVTLILLGRDRKRLTEVQEECILKGAEVIILIKDLSEKEFFVDWIPKQFSDTPFDLCIFSAGIMPVEQLHDADQQNEIFTVNILGMLNILLPLVPLMVNRGKGHLILLSSLRAFHGIGKAPAYCASKAAIMTYGLALRAQLWKNNIKVSVICPGFVDTPLTSEYKQRPLCMTVIKAAKIIRKGVTKNKAIISFPRTLYFLSRFFQMLPISFVNFLAKHYGDRI